ncbi:MAG: rRNA ((967)-C(5))-methyltransferase [Chthoniobacteraceae bacterium]|nr:rRNA ((967)-C(5))-methyltransferase [Chthoniobacteraceae bacterium]
MFTNARQACIHALLEWEKGRAFSDEILHKTLETARFSAPDRAFLMETFFGILRNLTELDFLISKLRDDAIDIQARTILRLGLYQLFHMRTPAHAAVNETVSLGGRARGLINALLRRAIREKADLEKALTQASLSIRTSHPEFLIERWNETFGADATLQLCAWNNQPAEVHVRANGLRVTVGELLISAPTAQLSVVHPKAIKVKQLPFSWILHGLCYVQDPSTLMACDLLDPQPGESVLDACAAPGGKTTYMAELMKNEGNIIACDLYESRVARLRENVQRLGVENTTVIQHDCMEEDATLKAQNFDRILVDAPCSNTGVIRRRVDVRWRLTEEDFIRMPAQQLALLKRTTTLLKPGGTLVYSTCSLEPEENDLLVKEALSVIPELELVESRRSLPFLNNVDGAFAAKFVRR